MSNQDAERPAKTANQRGAARLAAVPAIYQMDIGGSGVLEVVAEQGENLLGVFTVIEAEATRRRPFLTVRRET